MNIREQLIEDIHNNSYKEGPLDETRIDTKILNDIINELIPEGYTLVPVEPTDEMLSELCNGWESMAGNYMSENYKAMLSAEGKGNE